MSNVTIKIKNTVKYLYKDIKISLLGFNLCVFFGFLVMSCILSYCFNIYVFHAGEPLAVSFSGWVCSSMLTSLILLICVKWRWIGYIFLPFIVLVVAGGFYLHSVFDLFISFPIICCIAGTDLREASDYITPLSVIGVLFLVALSVASVYFAHRYVGKHLRYTHMVVSILLFSIGSGIAIQYSKKGAADYKDRNYFILARIWPFTDIRMTLKCLRDYREVGNMKIYDDIMALPSMADSTSTCSLGAEDQLSLVLHIGESLRGDHINFNGYQRETMPRMSKRLKNIVSFPKHYSYGLLTHVSIIGMLTTAEVSTRKTQHRPFIDLFNKHGYSSSCIFDTPSSLYILASGCKSQHLATPSRQPVSSFLDQMVDTFKEVQKQNQNFAKKFVLLNDVGAHQNFRSFPNNKQWLPDEFSVHAPAQHVVELTNAYDNNILEIDKELDEIISELENQVAVYVYVADHGLALCEDGKWGRPCDERSTMPAFFIWMSDSFIEKYPKIYQALVNNSQKAVSHDHILHTVLSLGGISSSLQKKELDLCDPNAQEYVQAPNLEEIIHIPLILNGKAQPTY